MEKKCAAVIGAGMAGVGAARELVEAGWEVTIFEKSRGWGGRCATKRWEECLIDHGPLWFTIRDPDFRKALETACGADLRRIEAPITTESGALLPTEDRFYHAQGNSRLVRALGADIPMRTGIPVGPAANRTIEGVTFDAIISTAPFPQTAVLAGLDDAPNPYAPCLTLLLLYSGDWPGLTASRYAISDRSGDPLERSACENHKLGRIRRGSTALVVQASVAFSRSHLEEEPAIWAAALRALAEERWQIPSSTLQSMHPHRWRYARVEHPVPIPTLPEGWHFAGDLLTESRLESAWLSGRATARLLMESCQGSERL